MLCCTAFLSGCITQKQKKALVVATYTYGDNNRLANIQPMALQLAEASNAELRLKSYRTIGELVEALRHGEADVAFMNTFGYLLLQTDEQPPVVPLATLEVPADAQKAYTSSLFASKQSGIENPDDLKQSSQQYSLVFAGRHSTSGNLIPRLFLSSLGITDPEQQFSEVDFMGSHAAALQEVQSGNADLAALGTGEFERQLLSGNIKQEEVTLLWESAPIPQGPVVAHASMPARQRKKLQQVLLQAHRKNPAAIDAIKRAWTEAWEAQQYVPVTENYYDSIRNMAGSKENLRQVLQQHLQ